MEEPGALHECHHLVECHFRPRPVAWPWGCQPHFGSNAGDLHCLVLQRMQFLTPTVRNQVGHVLRKLLQNANSSAQIQNLCRVLTPSFIPFLDADFSMEACHHQLRAEHPAPQNVTAQRLRKRSEMQRSASLHTCRAFPCHSIVQLLRNLP